MAKTTITIDASTRAVLRDALLELLGERAQRLQDALTRPDRERNPQLTRSACRRICLLGDMLERIRWGMDGAPEQIDIADEDELALLLAGVRGAVRSARDSAKDSRAYGDAEEAASARIRLRDSCDALLSLEAQAIHGGEPAG